MSNYTMYIDDIRDPNSQFNMIARSSIEAVAIMSENGCPNFISFDHDLGGNDTAMVVVNWMISHDLDHKNFIPDDFTFNVHSANPVGAKNIEGSLNSYLKFREIEKNAI